MLVGKGACRARRTHLPCLPSSHPSPRTLVRRYNPIKTIKTSFVGTLNMLGLAKRTNARFLISSTR